MGPRMGNHDGFEPDPTPLQPALPEAAAGTKRKLSGPDKRPPGRAGRAPFAARTTTPGPSFSTT